MFITLQVLSIYSVENYLSKCKSGNHILWKGEQLGVGIAEIKEMWVYCKGESNLRMRESNLRIKKKLL